MDHELLHRSVADLFAAARSRTCRVGVELELISRDARDGSVVPLERVRGRRAVRRTPPGWGSSPAARWS